VSISLLGLRLEQTIGAEPAHGISHAAGLIAALVATPFLIIHAVRYADTGFIVGASIFTATMVLLYLASTVYHALPTGKSKRMFRVIEHAAIYLLIAGTFTPFALGVLDGAWGWTLFGLIWGLAITGVALKVYGRMSNPFISTGYYLLMGWLILVAVKPLYDRMPVSGILWLVAGGVAYTAGVAFFATDWRLRYGHFIWHLFVIAGTTCHYFAVLWYGA
jgi:hemolysin III